MITKCDHQMLFLTFDWCSLVCYNVLFCCLVLIKGRCFACAAFLNAHYKLGERVDSRKHSQFGEKYNIQKLFKCKTERKKTLWSVKLFQLLDLSTACGQRRNQGFIVPAYFEVKMRIRYAKCVQVGRSVHVFRWTGYLQLWRSALRMGHSGTDRL